MCIRDRNIGFLHFGRLRPLHTNAVIFAFGGCALFATSYWCVQRTSHARLWGGPLVPFTFWGWQIVILLAAITLPLGITQGKEYAELEWPIDILITLVWVSYAIVFFGTIAKRKVSHIYVANWFFGAYIIAVALLPVSYTHLDVYKRQTCTWSTCCQLAIWGAMNAWRLQPRSNMLPSTRWHWP